MSRSLNTSMAAISSAVSGLAESWITETRYCIPIISCSSGDAPRGRPLTPATNTSAPIRHDLPDFLSRTFWYADEPGPCEYRPVEQYCYGSSHSRTIAILGRCPSRLRGTGQLPASTESAGLVSALKYL